MADSVLILGARGSLPVSGRQFTKYGGATSSYLVTLCGKTVVLDGGTGLLNLPEAVLAEPELDLILSHPHADHLMGLGMAAYPGRLRIFAKTRGGLSPREQVERFYSPPLWPVSPEAEYFELGEKTILGPITVETVEGVHPGGVSLIKLSGGGKTVVYATDTTITEERPLPAFAAGCDLLLCDGQYGAGDWEARRDYGHSTWEAAADAARGAGAKRLRIIHHDPGRSDSELDALSLELKRFSPDWDFAREGEEVFI